MQILQFLLRYSTLRAIAGGLLVLGFLAHNRHWFSSLPWLPDLLVLFGLLGIYAVQYLQLPNDRKRIDSLLQLLVILLFMVVAGIIMQHS